MAVFTIQYTQEQVRRAAGISSESLRHWRTAVEYLRSKKGKAARFSFADLVGLCMVRDLVQVLGLQVASIAPALDSLFQELNAAALAEMERSSVILHPRKVILVPAGKKISVEHVAVLIACGPIVAALRERILPSGAAPAQRSLPLPPRAVRR